MRLCEFFAFWTYTLGVVTTSSVYLWLSRYRGAYRKPRTPMDRRRRDRHREDAALVAYFRASRRPVVRGGDSAPMEPKIAEDQKCRN